MTFVLINTCAVQIAPSANMQGVFISWKDSTPQKAIIVKEKENPKSFNATLLNKT